MSDQLQILMSKLKKVEVELQLFEPDEKTHQYMGLAQERVKLGKQIAQVKWDLKTANEKEEFRNNDLAVSQKYFQKYGNEVEAKFQYKKKYIQLVHELRGTLANANESGSPLLQTISAILDSEEYVDIQNNKCINIAFEQLKLSGLHKSYNAILQTFGDLKNIAARRS